MSTTTRYHINIRVDTDSEAVGVDNRATARISHKIGDLVGPLADTNRVIVLIKKGTI